MSIAAIRESVIRAGLDATNYETGARRVQAANANMAASGERVAVAQEKTARTTLNSAGAVERLQRELDRTYQAQRRFEQAQERIASATDRGLISQSRGAELLSLARTRYLGAGDAAERASAGIGRFSVAGNAAVGVVEGMATRLGAFGTMLAALGPLGIAAGIAFGTVAAAMVPIARAGDAATASISRLAAATGSLVEARIAYQGLYEISARTGIAIAEGASAFQRFRIAAGEIGATNSQVLRLVEGLQKAAIVSGAVGQEGAAAMMQLGQALASGKLNGDELRSVMENMPSLAQALARELGTNIGQLRKMGEEGSLTADRVFPALLRATEAMSTEFDKMPLTMGRAFSVLGVEMTRFAEQLDEALGVSEAIARAVKAAADAVRGVRQAVLPTPEEKAANDVAEGQGALAALQSRLRAAESDIAMYERSGLSREQAIGLALPNLPGQKSVAEQWAAANRQLQDGLRAQFELRTEAAERENRASEEAAAKATASARERAATALQEDRLKYDKFAKAADDHRKRMETIAEAEAKGVTKHKDGTRFDATAERARAVKDYADTVRKLREAEERDGAKAARAIEKELAARDKVLSKLGVELSARQRMAAAQGQGEAAVQALNDQLAVENALREAGIPVTGARTEAEERYAAAIAETVLGIEAAKRREREIIDARAETKRELDRTAREIESQARRVSDDVATSIYEGLVEGRRGQNVLAWFGNLFKRIAIQAASTQIFLPITTGIIGSVPSLFGIGASGATGGGGMLSGLGDLLGLSNLLRGGGLGGLFSGALGATAITGWGTSTSAALGAMGGAYGPASLSQLNAFGGGGMFGGAGATFGQLFGGVGAGFGAGMLLNGLLGGNQTGGMIGSGGGAALGALIGSFTPLGPLLGGLLGGAAGGGLGGLIGPRPSVQGWGYWLEGNADGRLNPIDRRWFNESGAQQFAYADQQVAAVNAFLQQAGLTVSGSRNVGGNKNGPDGSWGGAGSFEEAFAALRFAAPGNANLGASLSSRSFAGVAALQEFVTGFLEVEAVIKQLTAEAVPAYTASLAAVNDNFEAARQSAARFGASIEGVAEAQARAIAELEAARTEQLRASSASMQIRRLAAAGQTMEADLARQAEAARQEIDAFGRALDALAITAEDKSNRLIELEQIQAAERAQIIARWGEQASRALDAQLNAGRSLLRDIAFGSASPLAPEQQYFAAISTLSAARRDLDAGGSLADYAAVAQQVLPVARDFLGTSTRYGSLVAEVGQVLQRAGADNAGLSQLLTAQVRSTDAWGATMADLGSRQVDELVGLRREMARLSAVVEALITRQQAA